MTSYTTSDKYTGTQSSVAEEDYSYDYKDWTNLSNAEANDGSYCGVTGGSWPSGEYSYVGRFTDFGFAIPSTATILGITVKVEAGDYGGTSCIGLIQLTKDGSARVGSNQEDNNGDLPNTPAVQTYGGTSSLWGATWTPTEINASTFGVHIAGLGKHATDSELYIDYVAVAVTYSLPDTKVFQLLVEADVLDTQPTVSASQVFIEADVLDTKPTVSVSQILIEADVEEYIPETTIRAMSGMSGLSAQIM